MQSIVILCVLAVLAGGVLADRSHEIYVETFDTAFGTTPPAGWLNIDLLKTFYYVAEAEDLWHFDNPGDQELVFPIAHPAAIFDSDTVSSSNNLPENSALVSPAFSTEEIDWRTTAVVLDWNQHFVEGYDAKIFVEVWDGDRWIEVFSTTQTTMNPDRQAHDISEWVSGRHGQGLSDARYRFRWTGDGSWFWIVDNVRLILVDIRSTTNGCPNMYPHKCDDGSCVRDERTCALENHCPANTPRRCLDGSCVVDVHQCSDLVDCPFDTPIRCADSSCAANEYECRTAGNCPITAAVRCHDGSCAADVDECPMYTRCASEEHPYPCIGGTCASSPDKCPAFNAAKLVCPKGQVQCLDLTCVDDEKHCSCPWDFPYLCTETRECVADAFHCKMSPKTEATNVLEKFGGHGAFRLRDVDACPVSQFRCFDGTCVRSLSECPHVLCSAMDADGHALDYKCPDGSCAHSREECTPIPACPNRDYKRCPDGTCSLWYEDCAPVSECSGGRVRCPDGRCYSQCPPFQGCPVDTPVECPNAQCAEREVQCYADCEPGWHTCYDGDACQIFDWDCPTAPVKHKAVPFVGSVRGISRLQTSTHYDIIYVADRDHDELFATVTVPKGLFDLQDSMAKMWVADVADSEVRPLPPYPETISPVLAVHLPEEVFANGDMIRISIIVEVPQARGLQDYCLASLLETSAGKYEWLCEDNNLVKDGPHYSGLVGHTNGLFIIMKKPGVCHKYRGFDDHLLEFIMLGRVLPTTINKLQQTYNKLLYVRDRMEEIKSSDLSLTGIAQELFEFSEQCISTPFQREISTFPPQLGYKPKYDFHLRPDPEPCCPGCPCQQQKKNHSDM